MRKTSIDLYRMGNAISPRLNNVRPQDVESYEKNGEIWVVENSGGISTFATQGAGKNWWKLDQGTIIPDALSLANDYKAALQSVAAKFYKMS